MNERQVGVALVAGIISSGIVGILATEFAKPWVEFSSILGNLTGIVAGGLTATAVYLRWNASLPVHHRRRLRTFAGLWAGMLVALVALIVFLTIGFRLGLVIVVFAALAGGVLGLVTAILGTFGLMVADQIGTRDGQSSHEDDKRIEDIGE